MKELITDIHKTLEDYQEGTGHEITPERIEKWISQFDEDDQEFILQELSPILKDRYVSKKSIKVFLRAVIVKLQKNYEYKTPQKFLKDTVFLDLQDTGKSQTVMLKLLDEILQAEFDLKLEDCGSVNQKYHIYMDDILCTGNTFFYDIKKWAGKGEGSNEEKVRKGEIELIICYVFIHTTNFHKVNKRFKRDISSGFASKYSFWRLKEIDNGNSTSSAYETLMPIEDDQSDEVVAYQEQITTEVDKYTKKSDYEVDDEFYRAGSRPKEEKFFSSPDNRIRFENILLNKGIEILSKASSQKPNIRALGYELPSHKNFGFGTLCFTWRNVPNNTPLVFWYAGGEFFPLFEKRRAIPTFRFA